MLKISPCCTMAEPKHSRDAIDLRGIIVSFIVCWVSSADAISVVVHYKAGVLSDFGDALINYSRWSQRWILRIRFRPDIDLVLAAQQSLPGIDID